MVNSGIQVRTLRPIIDSITGVRLVAEGTVGEVSDYSITPGPRSYIPTSGLFDAQLSRRLQFSVNFPQGVYQVTFPEQVEFVTEWGLLKVLLEGETVDRVESISPTPRFRSAIVRPLAVTLIVQGSLLRVTLLMDKASGFMDMELEAEES
jgi:hypothetical protein